MRPIERPGTAGNVARRVGSLATRFLVFRRGCLVQSFSLLYFTSLELALAHTVGDALNKFRDLEICF